MKETTYETGTYDGARSQQVAPARAGFNPTILTEPIAHSHPRLLVVPAHQGLHAGSLHKGLHDLPLELPSHRLVKPLIEGTQ
jgi:hypothetical protein